MNDLNKKRKIIDSLTVLFAAFSKSDDVDRIAIYANDLCDFEPQLIELACKKVRIEQTFLPTIADIIDACKSIVASSTGCRVPSWPEAQLEIRKQMANAGIYKKPVFGNVYIDNAVQSVGWLTLCNASDSQIGFLWCSVQRAYEKALQQQQSDDVNRYLLSDKPKGYLGYVQVEQECLLPIAKLLAARPLNTKK